jgi:ectoine hydroxylase-related dioxygenase (phytanoyl-CoA dioxygenase family)
MILRITPSEEERGAKRFTTETIDHAAQSVRVAGALILDNIIDAPLLQEARQAFLETYTSFLDGQPHDDALRVGDSRLMITVDIEPPFNEPQFFANEWLLQILRAALGQDFVLGAFGVVCSMPSAPRQHCHRDGKILFGPIGIDRLLPTYAVTVGIPLLDMNELHGTTCLWPGSHHDFCGESTKSRVEPVVQTGSCVFWDYRLLHGGTANRSTVPRPLLYLMYCRPWFVDHVNYRKQPPLRASRRWLATLSDENRLLLARALEC